VEVFTPSAQQSSLANKMQFFPPTNFYDKISATGLTKNIAGFHNRIKRHLAPFLDFVIITIPGTRGERCLHQTSSFRKVCLLIFETNLCCK
jgi:hypothetical protein